jgi:hypothetical protein
MENESVFMGLWPSSSFLILSSTYIKGQLCIDYNKILL